LFEQPLKSTAGNAARKNTLRQAELRLAWYLMEVIENLIVLVKSQLSTADTGRRKQGECS
jgi:hypothetical protein